MIEGIVEMVYSTKIVIVRNQFGIKGRSGWSDNCTEVVINWASDELPR